MNTLKHAAAGDGEENDSYWNGDSTSPTSDETYVTACTHTSKHTSASLQSSITSDNYFSACASRSESSSISITSNTSSESFPDSYGIPLAPSCIGSEELCYTYSKFITPRLDDGPLDLQVGLSELHGLGIFTTRRITKGCVIFSEKPAIIVSSHRGKIDTQELHQKLERMNEHQSASYRTLYPPNISNDDDLNSQRFKLNSFRLIGIMPYETRALFFGASRLNHSHEPNAAVTWDIPYMSFQALEDIEAGTEITIAYCCVNSGDQGTMGLEYGGFLCGCDKCSSISNDSKSSVPEEDQVCGCSFCDRSNRGFIFHPEAHENVGNNESDRCSDESDENLDVSSDDEYDPTVWDYEEDEYELIDGQEEGLGKED